MILHTTNTQPRDTIGKLVVYMTENYSPTRDVHIRGFLHMPYSADQLNWRRRNAGDKNTPVLGRIYAYAVIDKIPARLK